MKPKLRSDVTFYRLEDGTAFHRDGQWLRLDSPGIYDVLERLGQRLDGTRDLSDLLSDLRPERAEQLRRLILLLHKHDLVADAAGELPHTLSALLLSAYQAEIAFLDAHFGSGAARFEQFRRQRVLVIGDPSYTPAQAIAFAQLGVCRTTIYPPLPAPALAWIQETVAWLQEDDPERTVNCTDDLAAAVGLSDIVIVAPLSAPLQAYEDVTEALQGQQAWVMPVIVAGDEAWLGPIGGPSQAWIHWWSQLDAQFSDWLDLGTPSRAPRSEFWSPQTASYLANVAAYDMLRWVCCPAQDRPEPATLHVELESFQVESVHLPSLTAETHDSPRARLRRLESLVASPPLEPRRFAQAAVGLVGTHGPVTEFGELHLTQLPLHVIRAQLAGDQSPVYGYGLSGAEARIHCMRRAVEQLQQHHFERASGPVWMADVLSGEVLDCTEDLITAPAVLVTASGLTWPEAQDRALLDLYLEVLLGNPGGGDAELRPILDETEITDPELRRLLHILRLSDQRTELWSCSNDLDLPLVMVEIGGVVVGAALAPTVETARRDSLLRAVLYVQSKSTGEAEYCPPGVELDLRPSARPPCPDAGLAPFGAPGGPLDISRRVAASFARRGRRCVTTPASTGQALLAVLPFVAHAAALPLGGR